MNGAVFFIWFQSNLHAARDHHMGEFSDAEIAALQAVHTSPGLRQRLLASLSALRDRNAPSRLVKARAA